MWCSGLRIQHCHSCGLGCNCSSDLTPGLEAPQAVGRLKKGKKQKNWEHQKLARILRRGLPRTLLVGTNNGTATLENGSALKKKKFNNKNTPPTKHTTQQLYSGIHLRDVKSYTHTSPCTRMFTAAPLLTAQTRFAR